MTGHTKIRWSKLLLIAVLLFSLGLSSCAPVEEPAGEEPAGEEPAAEAPEAVVAPETGQWCSGMTIRALMGGGEGDEFATLLYRGALSAAEDLGPDVSYAWSMWDYEILMNDFREAVAVKPDGILMLGNPGYDALSPVAAEAAQEGILMTYFVVDSPELRQEFGGGFVGATDQYAQGVSLGQHVVKLLDLQPGGRAGIIAPWGLAKVKREQGVADALEEAGLIVDKIDEGAGWAADPNLVTPSFTSYIVSNPDVVLFVVAGGQMLSQAPNYMQAAGLEPGEIGFVGFDLSPAVMTAFESGYVQATSDQQPFLQGYLSILNLCLKWQYGFSALTIDTGGGIVDTTNFQNISEWAEKGYR